MTIRGVQKVYGYVVGTDGVVRTVLGAWYDPSKLRGPDMATLSLWPMGLTDLGGPGSGNYGHAGVLGHRGGSAPGGGHAAIGISPNASDEENRQAIERHHQAPPPPYEALGEMSRRFASPCRARW